mmetsp:Transcript_65905/g.130688  ORF Transcript_65905/g.130688 Transcript_65905/m.130688 type:complete len:220 (-) Transcript_65905:109-768(-)
MRMRTRPTIRAWTLSLGFIFAAHAMSDCPLSRTELASNDFLTHVAAPQAQPLTNCTQYAAKSCCNAEDTLRISHAEPEIRLTGATRACRDILHLLMCSVCSPQQGDIFLLEPISGFDVRVLQVCDSFCADLHRKCGSATLLDDGGTHERVDIEFEDGLALCQAVGLRAVPARDGVCFSSAPRRRLENGATMALVVALFASVSQLRLRLLSRTCSTPWAI